MKQHIILQREGDSSFKIGTLHFTALLKWVPLPPKPSCATSYNKGNKKISFVTESSERYHFHQIMKFNITNNKISNICTSKCDTVKRKYYFSSTVRKKIFNMNLIISKLRFRV